MATMRATVRTAPTAAPAIRAGRALSALAALFLAFDGGIKALQLAPAVESTAQLGYAADDNRLVQRWVWFSTRYDPYPAGNLFNISGQPKPLMNVYGKYIAEHAK